MYKTLIPVIAASLLHGCGDGSAGLNAEANASSHGKVVVTQKVLSAIHAEIRISLIDNFTSTQPLSRDRVPKCYFAIYRIPHTALDGDNQLASASIALTEPIGIDTTCRGSTPLPVHAHGAGADRNLKNPKPLITDQRSSANSNVSGIEFSRSRTTPSGARPLQTKPLWQALLNRMPRDPIIDHLPPSTQPSDLAPFCCARLQYR